MLEVVILAAGEGRRMNSSLPKVLQPLGGRPMLSRLLETVRALGPNVIHVVVGAGAEQVRQVVADDAGGDGIRWVLQTRRRGTGDALAQALPDIDARSRVVVLPGDMPLIRAGTLKALLQLDADLAVLGFVADDPTGYGRLVREGERVAAIVEEKDASASQKRIREVNSGVMCARAGDFSGWLKQTDCNNAQGEYYLTDCVGVATADGRRVAAVLADDAGELLGANDRIQLAALEQIWQQRARTALMTAGVTLLDPALVHVRGQVIAGRDVQIDINVVLEGDNRLGDGVSIGAGCVLRNCDLAAGTRVEPLSVLEGVRTTGACRIGPFARLRPDTELAVGVRIGNFVELKNARLDKGAKVSHLSYIGDAQVGCRANVGAGTITCNYDGVNKHRTTIGDDAFIGSNSALVAPVDIGRGATIGAGSVITANAPQGQLTLSRVPQRSLEGWKRPRRRKND